MLSGSVRRRIGYDGMFGSRTLVGRQTVHDNGCLSRAWFATVDAFLTSSVTRHACQKVAARTQEFC